MKTKLISKLLFVAVIGFTFLSCKKEGCTNMHAENYDEKAKKEDGSCTYARDKFFGTYATSQTCVYDGVSTFSMSVSAGPVENEIILGNFAGFGVNVRAVVNGNLISFSDTKNGIVFEGDGYLTGNNLSIDFEVCEEYYYPCSDPDVCSLTGSK